MRLYAVMAESAPDARSGPGQAGPIFLPRRFPSHRSPKWDEVHELGNAPRSGSLQGQIAGMSQKAPSHTRKKISTGLILVRTPDQTRHAKDSSGGREEYQAILVKGRLTYAFSDFIHGRYDQGKLDTVRQLLSNMTIEERMLLETLDFQRIWDVAWPKATRFMLDWRPGGTTAYDRMRNQQRGWPATSPQRETLFQRRRAKFTDAWLANRTSTDKLLALLREVRGGGTSRWEFPKGKRHSSGESDISCALRECREETGISPSAYRILPGFSRVELYVHMRVLYVNTYFLAVLDRTVADPAACISLSSPEQVTEISDVRWMGLEDMRRVIGPVGRDLTVMARAAFRYVRDYRKGKVARLVTPKLQSGRKRWKDKPGSKKGKQKPPAPRSPKVTTSRAAKAPSRSARPRPQSPPALSRAPSAVTDDGWQLVRRGRRGYSSKPQHR